MNNQNTTMTLTIPNTCPLRFRDYLAKEGIEVTSINLPYYDFTVPTSAGPLGYSLWYFITVTQEQIDQMKKRFQTRIINPSKVAPHYELRDGDIDFGYTYSADLGGYFEDQWNYKENKEIPAWKPKE